MKSFICRLLIATGLATLTGGCAPVFLPVHVSVPINLSKAGNVAEAEFRIWLEDHYEIILVFTSPTGWAPLDNELLKFLGYAEHKPGAIIPIRLIISKLNETGETIVLDEVFATEGARGVGAQHISRHLTINQLEPGKHKIRIESKKDFPELANIPVTLELFYFRR